MSVNHCVENCEAFLLDYDGSLVVFTVEGFKGMVGESVEVYRAHHFESPFARVDSVKKTELDYTALKSLYNTQTKNLGKSQRISFWRWMREFSPKYVERRLEAEAADAISRVR